MPRCIRQITLIETTKASTHADCQSTRKLTARAHPKVSHSGSKSSPAHQTTNTAYQHCTHAYPTQHVYVGNPHLPLRTRMDISRFPSSQMPTTRLYRATQEAQVNQLEMHRAHTETTTKVSASQYTNKHQHISFQHTTKYSTSQQNNRHNHISTSRVHTPNPTDHVQGNHPTLSL